MFMKIVPILIKKKVPFVNSEVLGGNDSPYGQKSQLFWGRFGSRYKRYDAHFLKKK